MNLNEMQNVWNSPRNRLPAAEQQLLAEKFNRQMIRRHRFQSLWLINTFVWLTIITVTAIWSVVAGATSLAQEWGLFPLLIVPWGFASYFLWRYLKPITPITRGELSVVDSLQAARISNHASRAHLKLIGVLYVILIPVLVLTMQQLQAVGKVSPRELTSMAVLFGGALLISAIGVAVRYFGRLLPQQKQLDALLMELTDEKP